jgi:serine/threonine protein kinase
MEAILTEHPLEPVPVNPQLPAGLNELILTMLAKDPAMRPSAGEVASRLAEISPLLTDAARASASGVQTLPHRAFNRSHQMPAGRHRPHFHLTQNR